MSTEEVFDSAVDAALDVIGGSRYFGLSDEVEKVWEAVAEQGARGPERAVGVPPPAWPLRMERALFQEDVVVP